jgi:thiamine-monophosphate kinase
MAVKRVADLGELALLARIEARIGPASAGPDRPDVVAGIGDDTAALNWTSGNLVLFTTDALVEDVHFRRATSAPADVGWKALAINASDIAAMGGDPRHAVISLILPAELDVEWVDGLYDGMLAIARDAGIAIVGGNLAQAPSIVVDVALLGEVEPHMLLRRTGARPGDLVAVTGTLGRAAAGLMAVETMLATGGIPPGEDVPAYPHTARGAPVHPLVERAIAAQRRPLPRLAEGRALAATRAVRAMIDLSDGLALDLWRLCEANGLGVRVDASRIPVDACVPTVLEAVGRDAAGHPTPGSGAPGRSASSRGAEGGSALDLAIAGRTALDLAIAGGEDYELLFAVAPDAAGRVLEHLSDATGTPAVVIGRFEEASAGRIVVMDRKRRPLEPEGWTHFRA